MLKAMSAKLLPRWFTLWFYISTLVLFAGGLANQLTGTVVEGFDPFGAAISITVMYILMITVWRYRDLFSTFVTRIPLPVIVLSVLVGWFFSQIDELVSFSFNPLFPGVTLWQDLLYTSIMYIPGHIGWFFILRRYAFTPAEALITGGFSLSLFEMLSGGVLGLLGLIVFPFVVMIHGTHMIMPKLALGPHLTFVGQKETRWKYVWGVMVPVIGVGIGIGLAFGLVSLTQFATS
ncbi:MAG: hypothetical protein AAB758_01780 [Patescibacteria group bacterium]